MGGVDVGYNVHIFTFFFYPLELSFPWSPATGGLNNMSLEIRGGEMKSASVKYAEACLKCFAQTFEQLTE